MGIWLSSHNIAYGGYAALVAASREDQIYQCAVAGAAVADNNQQVNYYRFNTRGTQKTEQLNFWDGSISPIEEAAKVNIPLLLVHGDVDQRVPFKHFEKYTAELDKNNIAYQSLVLEGADHFLNTLTSAVFEVLFLLNLRQIGRHFCTYFAAIAHLNRRLNFGEL